MDKKVIFKMYRKDYDVTVACTSKFINEWQKEKFTLQGYLVVDQEVKLMDFNAKTIPDNLCICDQCLDQFTLVLKLLEGGK